MQWVNAGSATLSAYIVAEHVRVSLAACCCVDSEIYGLSNHDVVYMASPLTFDPSVVEIFTTLWSGATLLILDDWMKLRPRDLAVMLTTVHHVTVLQVMISI